MFSIPKLAGPVIVTVPALVSGLYKMTFPEMFNTPLLAMVTPMPLNVPPDQLNVPPIITGLNRSIVPVVKLTVSLVAGTPVGVQFPELNQSLLTEPFQVNVLAEHLKTWSKIDRQNRRNLMFAQTRRFN